MSETYIMSLILRIIRFPPFIIVVGMEGRLALIITQKSWMDLAVCPVWLHIVACGEEGMILITAQRFALNVVKPFLIDRLTWHVI